MIDSRFPNCNYKVFCPGEEHWGHRNKSVQSVRINNMYLDAICDSLCIYMLWIRDSSGMYE